LTATARASSGNGSLDGVPGGRARGSAVAPRLAARDGSSTPLGPRDRWPAALVHAVELAQHSEVPMLVAWGDELVTIGNDALARLAGVDVATRLLDGASDVWPQLAAALLDVRASGQACTTVILGPDLRRSLELACSVVGGDGVFAVARDVAAPQQPSAGAVADSTADEATAATPTTFMELGSALDASRTLDEVVELITHAASDLVGADVAVTTLAGDEADEPSRSSVVADSCLSRRGRDRPMMGAPMVSPVGDRLGLIQVAGRRAGGHFDEHDLDRLVQLAQLAAARIEHFRDYLRAENIATELQHRLLPEALPQTEGVSAAAAYIAGSNEADVGGDWYDLVPLDDGTRLLIAIGDMVGRGIAAAAAMSELRNALRLLAAEGTQPAEALTRLNEFVHAVGSGHFATVWYCIVDREEMTITYASAGHVPPLLFEPMERARLIDGVNGPPIGARRGAKYREERISVAPGSTFVLYTDGLVEHGLTADADPIDRLVAETVVADPAEMVRRLTAILPDAGDRRDDTAVLAVRVDPVRDAFRYQVPLDLAELRALRHALRGWLEAHDVSDRESTEIVLAMCEIVTNAIEHPIAPSVPWVDVVARRGPCDVTLRVRDHGHWRSRRHEPERGRGIAIVRRLVDVDFERAPTGTTVVLRRPLHPSLHATDRRFDPRSTPS
jgi:serine phosphatase RsbU (regulator of sigma subunit)/anti-sigma regulatory factor (Ser/Thr protein kinase)